MKNSFKKICVLLLVLVVSVSAFAQKKYGIDDPNARYGGLALIQTDNGGGIGGFFEWALNSNSHLTANLNLIIVRGDNDYPIYNYYYYYYGDYYVTERLDKTRLNFAALLVGYKRILLSQKLANNFRPFLFVEAGPLIAIDPPNDPDFSYRIKNIDYYYNGTAHIGAGIDFATLPRALISLFVGYEYIRFPNKIDVPEYLTDGYDPVKVYDGKQDYSGIIVKISFGKKY
jgi:hypothetical protein